MVDGVKMFGGAYTSDDLKKMIASMALQIANKNAEIAALKAEVERLNTPDSYSFGDKEYETFAELMDVHPTYRILEVIPKKPLPNFFAVKFPINNNGESPTGDRIEMFKTEEEAMAFVKSLKLDEAEK